MFTHLSSKADNGIGVFRAILNVLINWSTFDSYFFDKLKKLDKNDAIRAIEHLKQLQEIRDNKIKVERGKREEKQKQKQVAQKSLSELKEQFFNFYSNPSNSAKRGYELEKIILELAKISKMEITEPFKVVGEQIDGAIKFDGEHYIVEAKWQDAPSANEAVYQFAHKVEGKFYGRGIFISVNGFSSDVLTAVSKGKSLNMIFVDGGDIVSVLEELLSFKEMLDKKIKAAQTRGETYINAFTEKSKIKE